MSKENTSEWQTQNVTKMYLEGIRGAIPAANLQLEIMLKIISAWNKNPHTVLDLGCGDGILGRMIMECFPNTQVIFMDFSDPMLSALEKKVPKNSKTSIINGNFGEATWLSLLPVDKKIDLVLSGFAIHHLSDERKQELYLEIFNLLPSNGVFLNLEHVASSSEEIEKIHDDYFVDHIEIFNKKIIFLLLGKK